MINLRPTKKEPLALSLFPCFINIYGATLHFYQNSCEQVEISRPSIFNHIAKFHLLWAKQSQMPGLCLGYWNYDMIVTRAKAL